MRKIIFCLLCLVAITNAHAQKVIPAKKPAKKDTIKNNKVLITTLIQPVGTIVLAPGVLVYELPDLRGRSASFVKNAEGKFVFPFPVKNVSIKVPEGTIVYIQRCFEFASENAYNRSIAKISLEDFCGIRTDEQTIVKVNLAGISTEIHNTDCMRFAGKIEAKLIETAPSEPGVETLMPCKQVYWNNPRYRGYGATLMDMGATPNTDRAYNPSYTANKIIYNNNPVPILIDVMNNHTDSLTLKRLRGYPNYSPIATFFVGKAALREGRVKLWLKTNLVSAHKTCNLCDDFSSKIKMDSPAYEAYPLNRSYDGGKIINASNRYVVAGPYAAKGSRDGAALTASGGTFKNFRVHLIVDGL